MRWERSFHMIAWGFLLIGWPTVMLGAFLPNATIATAGVWIMISSFGIAVTHALLEQVIQSGFHHEED